MNNKKKKKHKAFIDYSDNSTLVTLSLIGIILDIFVLMGGFVLLKSNTLNGIIIGIILLIVSLMSFVLFVTFIGDSI